MSSAFKPVAARRPVRWLVGTALFLLLGLVSWRASCGAETIESARRREERLARSEALARLEAELARNPALVRGRDKEGYTRLHRAAWRGRVEEAKLLLAHGADVNAVGPAGRRPLHVAAWEGTAAMVKVLVQHKAQVDAVDRGHRETPLHWAMRNYRGERAQIASILLSAGATVDPRDNERRTPFYYACASGDLTTVRMFVAHKADANAKGHLGSTPFYMACGAGQLELVRLLLAKGAKIGTAAPTTGNPLYGAAYSYSHSSSRYPRGKARKKRAKLTAELLLARGAQLDFTSAFLLDRPQDFSGQLRLHPHSVNNTNSGRFTMLHWAVKQRRHDLLDALLKVKYVKINVEDSRKLTPLHWAVKYGNQRALRSLLAAKADTGGALSLAAECGNKEAIPVLLAAGADVNGKKGRWGAPLFRARTNEVRKLLLDAGADVDAGDSRGRTLLHRAAEFNDLGLARLMLDSGAAVDAHDRYGDTPLTVALRSGYGNTRKVAELLLAKGADVRAGGRWSDKPLHLAISRGDTQLAGVLLKRGANIDAPGKQSRTALHVAATMDGGKTTRYLLERKAGVNARDRSGQTPLHYAVRGGVFPVSSSTLIVTSMVPMESRMTPGHKRVVELLLKHKALVNAKDKKGRTPLAIVTELARTEEQREKRRAQPSHGAPIPPGLQSRGPVRAFIKYSVVVELLKAHGAQ